ncbi:hypothetical protein K2173_019767 [Erythroxylum novogranatense]|uniref:Homeodomain-like superfamily protein n=1 Tax=Erythroxylum novogranatense TaxID=1862640 RepID=A0AAV8SMV1_9ROSI|nr:hypothetical protein K2173_019767 [Erythroxylum novogranatense]
MTSDAELFYQRRSRLGRGAAGGDIANLDASVVGRSFHRSYHNRRHHHNPHDLAMPRLETRNERLGEDDEDEEEDLDFNPFLKDNHSLEASSSLSSEVEVLETISSKTNEVWNYSVGNSEHSEEVIMRNLESESEIRMPRKARRKCKKNKFDSRFQVENQTLDGERENGSTKNVNDGDNDDAICKRTRARYSLTSFTLDELETFLQETDDEDELHNVDDEEEYRKFLAAVLQGGDGDGQSIRENENVDDEDEDNDADFEIELEELLESDVDGVVRDKGQKLECERGTRRPETRQNRRQKASSRYRGKFLEQSERPLRPLLPVYPCGGVVPCPAIDGNVTASSYQLSSTEDCLVNGFIARQIGQLHCLIHEHIQLLIQVFSLCILDPSRQLIASQVEKLIFEMLCKRDEVRAWRTVSYPDICFNPSNLCPSVVNEVPNLNNSAHSIASSPTQNSQLLASQDFSSSQGNQNHSFNGKMFSSQSPGSSWVPLVSSPIVSILDVAPLNLVRKYIDDAYNAVQDYRHRPTNSNFDVQYEKQPLFCLPNIPSLAESNNDLLRGAVPPIATPWTPTLGEQQTKKTLAASIVERAKKQPIALVPKDISKLAQRFIPLFNPALFPHKPPPVAVVKRILFTDAEDELLALGMMEYNTNWKAIQQRFLPCKSKHQIFVRQKNRCSSKAPENPIKAVRRMKTSPLTLEEIERIQEGLEFFKLDWMSVWKFVVPHRDPSLLPRQWRIALGTQRSYKVDADKKAKRRIYESNRRKRKLANLANWQELSDKEENQVEGKMEGNHSEDDCMGNANEAYVHQGFLADWRPGATSLLFNEHPCLDITTKGLPSNMLPTTGSHIKEQPKVYGPGGAQSLKDTIHGFPYASHYCHYPPATSDVSHVRHFPCNSTQNRRNSAARLNASKSKIYVWPYRTRRRDGACLVKLAPELPPVNLPPSVRVIPQSVLKTNQSEVSMQMSARKSGSGSGEARMEVSPKLSHLANFESTSSAKTNRNKHNQVRDTGGSSFPEEATISYAEESAVQDTVFIEQKGNEADCNMHPLLFQDAEGRVPYFSLSCNNGSSGSFSLFSGNQPQLNLTLFRSSHQVTSVVDYQRKGPSSTEFPSASCAIDFHPLLQRTDDGNSDFVTQSFNLHHGQNGNQFDSVQTTVAKPSTSTEKSSELDLEIHLSSASINNKAMETRNSGKISQPRSTVDASISGNTMVSSETDSPHPDCNNNNLREKINPLPDADGMNSPSNNVDRCDMDESGDQSNQEIVMEQEELSDSDEETEENVEFECEEMTDSDGEEGSGSEPTAEIQDKVVPRSAMGKLTTDDQQCGVRSSINHQDNTSVLSRSSPLLRLSPTSPGKDGTSAPWLSLDSCAPIAPESTKAKWEK